MKQGVIGCAAGALVLFVSLGSETTVAAEAAGNNERGFYLGASVGRVEQEAKGEGQILVAVGFPFGFVTTLQPDRVEIDDTDAGWNVMLGYRINKYFAAELSYSDFGEALVTEHYAAAFVPIPLNITVRSNIEAYGPAVSLLGTFPLTPAVDVFARGGVLFLDQKIERQNISFRSAHRTGDEIWTAGAGVQWFFTSRWATRLEYQLTDRIGRESNALTPRAGTTKIEQLSLGVSFDF